MFNGANTGFMLLAAALVMLMTPGLAFFYGGLVGRSNTLTIMIQSFASMGVTTVMWFVVGYTLARSQAIRTYCSPVMVRPRSTVSCTQRSTSSSRSSRSSSARRTSTLLAMSVALITPSTNAGIVGSSGQRAGCTW